MTDQDLRQLLQDAKVIAVVGLSANPDRASNQVAWYLHHQGYRLFGINPACPEPEVNGIPMLASLDEVPEPIDIVDVFRRPEHTPEVARAAVAAGARALWLQLGIASDESRAIATEAGLTYVEDRCLKVDHARLLGPSEPLRAGRRPADDLGPTPTGGPPNLRLRSEDTGRR